MTTSERITILMVDDQPAKLVSYEVILQDLGMNLLKATTARDALEQLLKNEVAIVLMDVSMPEMDGFELAAMIRDHPRYQKTAIIFVSAERLTDLDRLKGYEVGAIDYIPVPVVPEILRAKVGLFAELFHKTRQLEELNRDLERRVEERTAELQTALQARDHFISVAAHELRTPVTAIRVTAQAMSLKVQRGELSGPKWMHDGLQLLDHQTGRLARLIGQLLDTSRLDQDKLLVERVETNLAELVEKVVEGFRVRSDKHTLALAIESGLIADIDPMGIEQVLSNLLDNAIKYSPDGGRIDIESGRIDASHAYLSVRDRGIGIPPEMRDSIFKRFYQAHTEDYRSGLGLGLYISAEIVARHEGEIVAEFPPDGGTRFVVQLPLRLYAPTHAAVAQEAHAEHR